MRTTLDIDDDVLAAAKELARLEGKTAGQVVSELARRGLRREAEPRVRNGIELLPPRGDVGIVTVDHVKQLLDEAP